MKRSLLKKDPEKEQQGVWFTYYSDFRVRIRPFQCKEMQSFIQSHQILLQQDPEEYDRQLKDRIARHIVTDWSGLEDDETGASVPYSVEECLRWLEEDEHFSRFVVISANTYEHFLRTKTEEDIKN